MDITTFVSKKTREKNVMEKFEKLVKGKGDKRIREIEMRLLKPAPVPAYRGPKPVRADFKRRSLRLAFSNKTVIERLSKYIRISQYVENNSHDVGMFLELLRLLERDRLVWDPKRKRFSVLVRKGVRVRL